MKIFASLQIISLIGFCFLNVQVVEVEGSFWDTIPVFAQLKFVVQYAKGDIKGARMTQDNFSRGFVLFGPIRAAGEFIKGDKKEAVRTIQYVYENVEFFFAGIPVLGHLIGLLLLAKGERERGEQAIKFATRNIGVGIGGMAGFVVGGPKGAIAGGVAGGIIADTIITKVESSKRSEFTPFGLVEGGSKIAMGTATTGEAFDVFALIVADALYGYYSGREMNNRQTKKDDNNKNSEGIKTRMTNALFNAVKFESGKAYRKSAAFPEYYYYDHLGYSPRK